MLRNEDLKAAVDAGVITPEQKAVLEKQAAARVKGRAIVSGRDERFRFLKGFNDVFLSLGVVLIAAAFMFQWSPSRGQGFAWLLVGAAVLWAISEVLVDRYRAVMPGIVACLGIGLMVSLAAGQWAFMNSKADLGRNFWNFPFTVWMAASGAGGLATLLYYIRFGLPFAWLPMGYCLAQTAVVCAAYFLGWEKASPLLNGISLALGLGLFALALRFDASDPERITRRSDCGFWLHMAAAPFIVQTTIGMIGGSGTNSAAAIMTILVVPLLGIIAVIIDRRALLVSSLLYFGFAVGFLVTQTTADRSWQGGIATTLALLGAFVILLGMGWHPLRRLILKPFAGAAWLGYLPPVQPLQKS